MIHGFLVQAGGNLYAVPISSVARTVEVEFDNLETEGGEMWLRSKEERIQMYSLAGLMNGNGGADEQRHKRAVPALLFHCDDRTRGILVDAVLGKRDMVVKPLHSPLENLREYSGATILEEGRIALILDLQNLIAGGEGEGEHPRETAHPQRPGRTARGQQHRRGQTRRGPVAGSRWRGMPRGTW